MSAEGAKLASPAESLRQKDGAGIKTHTVNGMHSLHLSPELPEMAAIFDFKKGDTRTWNNS